MIVVENRATQDHFSKVSIYNFLGLKNMKKGYIEMTKKNYLETFEKYPGSPCFSLLKRYAKYGKYTDLKTYFSENTIKTFQPFVYYKKV